MKSLRKTAIALASLVMLGTGSLAKAAPVLLVGNSNDNGNVLRFDAVIGASQGRFVAGSGTNANSNPDPNGPVNAFGIGFGPDGNFYVADIGGGNVRRFNGTTGAFIDIFVPRNEAVLNQPFDLIFNPEGNLLVAGFSSNAVVEFNSSGAPTGSTATASGPIGLAIRGTDLFVSNSSANTITRFDANTLTPIGSGPFISTNLSGPSDLVFAPNGDLFVSNGSANSISQFSATGAFIRTISNAALNIPFGLAIGPGGNLFVASNGNNSILRFNSVSGAFIDVFASGNGLVAPTFLLFADLPAVPEPSSIALVALGGLGLVAIRRGRKAHRTA